jgi:hypothetical protein
LYLYITTKWGDRQTEQTRVMITEQEYIEMKEFNKEFEEGGVLGTNEVFKTYFNNLYKIKEYETQNKK